MWAQVLGEFIDLVEEQQWSGEIFKMPEMKKLYDSRPAALGFPELKSITSRLREDIERMIRTSNMLRKETAGLWCLMMISATQSKTWKTTYNLGCWSSQSSKDSYTRFSANNQTFTGVFTPSSETDSTPTTLKSFWTCSLMEQVSVNHVQDLKNQRLWIQLNNILCPTQWQKTEEARYITVCHCTSEPEKLQQWFKFTWLWKHFFRYQLNHWLMGFTSVA